MNKNEFTFVYTKWKSKEITAVQAMSILGLKPNTFYRRVKEYENILNDNDNE